MSEVEKTNVDKVRDVSVRMGQDFGTAAKVGSDGPQRSNGSIRRMTAMGRKQRKTKVKYDKRSNRIEIMFGSLEGWRRVVTGHDKWPKVFLSAIALAAIVTYWL